MTMTQSTMRYVLYFRGNDPVAAAAAVQEVREMSGVRILHESRRAMLVEVAAADSEFASRVEAAGKWGVSEERIYQLA
jgi:hypothetical protein